MMLFLVRNVALHALACRRAHGERRVSFLPREILADLRMDPLRGRLFQFAHHIRQTMRRLESNKQMHVVSGSSNSFGKSAQPANSATEIFVQPLLPGVSNRG